MYETLCGLVSDMLSYCSTRRPNVDKILEDIKLIGLLRREPHESSGEGTGYSSSANSTLLTSNLTAENLSKSSSHFRPATHISGKPTSQKTIGTDQL